tara:strand:+ start:1497 stop:2600 length:1104 start_codon:yes stop_codon:yes gene_type:complete
MTNPLRYGLLGAGMMGREHLRNLALLNNVQVVAVCEPNPAMLEKAQALAPDAVFVADLKDLLKQRLDALVIATPNFTHCEQLLTVLDACDVPVLIEKPLVTSEVDVARIRRALAERASMVWVGMEYRFMPALTAFDAKRPDIGQQKMLSIREHRYPFLKKVDDWNRFNRYSGGTFVEKCCHFFDLMRLFLEAEPVRVFASAAQDVNHLAERYNGEQPDIWDNGYVIIDFDNGCRGMLDLCMFSDGVRFEQEVSLVGDLGRLDCQIPGPFRVAGALPEPARLISSSRAPSTPVTEHILVPEAALNAGSHQGATFFQHQAFLAAVLRGGPPAVSVEDGLMAVLMGLAAQASASTGKAVGIDAQNFRLQR